MKTFRLLFSISILLFALNNYAAESWRTHLMYSSVTQVAETPTKVYGLADGALFSYDKSTSSINIITRTNGLNDSNISLIAYNTTNNTLIVVYSNSNLDLIEDNGTITNIPDVKNKSLNLNKSINNINFYNNRAYLSTQFGLIILNLNNKSFENTVIFGKSVSSIAFLNGSIFAATNSGIYSTSSNNIIDLKNWNLFSSIDCSNILVYDNSIVGLKKGIGIYKFTNSAELKISSPDISKIKLCSNNLISISSNELKIIKSWNDISVLPTPNIIDFSSNNLEQNIWTSNQNDGINFINNLNNEFVSLKIKPNGPISNIPYKIKFNGNILCAVGGGAWYDRYNTPAQFFTFNNDSWSNLRTDTITAQGAPARDFVDFAIDPTDPNHVFFTSYGEGVYEFKNSKLITIHDHTNSAIETIDFLPGALHCDRVHGINFDNKNNLLITNTLVKSSIKVYTPEKTWISLTYNPISRSETLFHIFYSKCGLYFALASWKRTGLFIFDVNNTISDQSDDRFKFFESIDYIQNGENKTTTTGGYLCLVDDKLGKIWTGTDIGPIVINNPTTIFDVNFKFTRPIAMDDNGNSNYLLNNLRTNAIAVDASNRKWLGTQTNGLYLVNEDGTKIIKHFTYENSPLLSNKILSLAIHPTTGEVFIGTDKGLISYTNDGLESKKNFSEVYAYPNPVKPEFEGDITITGLKAGADIRILNSGGNTVFEGKCETDEIVWSGKDSNNNRVDTGVYTVYAAVPGSLESMVTRIFIIK